MIKHALWSTLVVALATSAAAKAPSHFNGGLDPWVELESEARKAAEVDAPRVSAPTPSTCAPAGSQIEMPAPDPDPDQLAEPEPPPDAAPEPPFAPPSAEPVRVPDPEPAFAEMATPTLDEAEPAEPAEPAGMDALDAPIPLESPDARLLSEAIVEASNEARAHHGLPTLPADFRLHRAAAGHAHRMARLGFFAHRDPHAPDRRTPTDRARSAGIANPAIAENIATALVLDLPTDQPLYVIDADRGLFSLKAGGPPLSRRTYRQFGRHVVRRWLASPGHRRNLLAKEAVQIGAAAAPFDQAGGIPTLSAVQVFQWFHPAAAPD